MFHVKGDFYGRLFITRSPAPQYAAVLAVVVVIKVSGRRN